MEAKARFIEEQFALQHHHFTRFHPRAGFWIIQRQGVLSAAGPIGRLYLDRSRPRWLIVDIALVAAARDEGLGTALLAWLQALASEAGTILALSVAIDNPRARALYRRLGFREEGEPENLHQGMIWAPPIGAMLS